MKNGHLLTEYSIDFVEIYTPMAKVLAYWHVHALGFKITASMEGDMLGVTSYVLESNGIRLVLTASYPVHESQAGMEISSYVSSHHMGVKRFALSVNSVKEVFEFSLKNGAIPIRLPARYEDELGVIEEAAIKLYDSSEIVFIDRSSYRGTFKPGYIPKSHALSSFYGIFNTVDHIAGEVRINESNYWANYLTSVLNTEVVQSIDKSSENETGMILKINQSFDKNLTLVIAEPDKYDGKSKVQNNIDKFGPGIHHLAFTTDDLFEAVKHLAENDVEFVNFPSSYYNLLRQNESFKDFDIDALEKYGILIDKEDDAYLLQKFIKPISDRPFFFYEIVQRINGYTGFALKNINVLKKAEEIEIMKS